MGNELDQNRFLSTIGVLAENFTSIFYYNQADGAITPIRTINLDPEILKEFEKVSGMQAQMDVYVRHACHPDDAAGLSRFGDLDYVMQQLEGKNQIQYQYRRLQGDQIRYYRLLVGRTPDNTGLVYGYENIDEQVRADLAEKEKLAQALAIIGAVSTEFHTIFAGDKDTLQMHRIRSSLNTSEFSESLDLFNQFTDLDSLNQAFVSRFVVPVERAKVLAETASEEILRQLETGDSYVVNYRHVYQDNHIGYEQMVFVNADTPSGSRMFVAGFRNIDSVITAQRERQRELEEANHQLQENVKLEQIINGLTYDYRSMLRVNLETGNMDILSVADSVGQIMKQMLAGKSYPDAMNVYINNMVFDEDRD